MFSFLNRSIPLFPREQVILKSRGQMFIKIEVPLIDKISGLFIVMMFNKKTQDTLKLKIRLKKFSNIGCN